MTSAAGFLLTFKFQIMNIFLISLLVLRVGAATSGSESDEAGSEENILALMAASDQSDDSAKSGRERLLSDSDQMHADKSYSAGASAGSPLADVSQLAAKQGPSGHSLTSPMSVTPSSRRRADPDPLESLRMGDRG